MTVHRGGGEREERLEPTVRTAKNEVSMRRLPRNRPTCAAPESARRPHAWPGSAQPWHPESSVASLPSCRQRPHIRKHPASRQSSPSLSVQCHRIASRAHFSPAFLSITFKVPGASSLPSLSGTVITEVWFGCLKCRWLPLDRISTHPCFASKRITSRTNGIRSEYTSPPSPPALPRSHPESSGWGPPVASVCLYPAMAGETACHTTFTSAVAGSGN